MNRLTAFAGAITLAAGAITAPVSAATTANPTGDDYIKSAAECLVLLFTNPQERAAKCGTPDVLPPPPSGSTGFARTCHFAEIDPFGIDGVQYQVAGPSSCCTSSLMPTELDRLHPASGLVWTIPASRAVLAAC